MMMIVKKSIIEVNIWATHIMWGTGYQRVTPIHCPGLIAAPSVNRDIDDDDHRMICDCDVDDICDDNDNNDHIDYYDADCGDSRRG